MSDHVSDHANGRVMSHDLHLHGDDGERWRGG